MFFQIRGIKCQHRTLVGVFTEHPPNTHNHALSSRNLSGLLCLSKLLLNHIFKMSGPLRIVGLLNRCMPLLYPPMSTQHQSSPSGQPLNTHPQLLWSVALLGFQISAVIIGKFKFGGEDNSLLTEKWECLVRQFSFPDSSDLIFKTSYM